MNTLSKTAFSSILSVSFLFSSSLLAQEQVTADDLPFDIYLGVGGFGDTSNDSSGVAAIAGLRYSITENVTAEVGYNTSGSFNLFGLNGEDKISIEDHSGLSASLGYFHQINNRHELFASLGFLHADVDYIEERGFFKTTENKSESSYLFKAGWQMTFDNKVTLGAQYNRYELLNIDINSYFVTLGYAF